MANKVFEGKPDRLRAKERIELLEVERVVELCLEGLFITKVLDIGCGTGIFAEAFSLRNLEVHGIDSNPEMIETATKLVCGASFKEGQAEKLPYHDHSIDLCFMAHVLHETDEPIKVLMEAARVSTSRVAILEWGFRSEEYGPPLAHRMSVDTIKNLAKEAGFSKLEVIPLTHMNYYRMSAPQGKRPRRKRA